MQLLREAVFVVLAISDIALVKSIATGITKGGIKVFGKNYKTWGQYRRFYGKEGFAKSQQHLHHWMLKRNGAKKGQGFSWKVKNQMWNLQPVPKINGMTYDAVHKAIEGKGVIEWSIWRRFYYGTPSWVKTLPISTVGRGVYMIDYE